MHLARPIELSHTSTVIAKNGHEAGRRAVATVNTTGMTEVTKGAEE
jgi:hypothetical protein